MPPCAAKRPHGSPAYAKAPAPGRDRARPLPSYRKYSKKTAPPSHPGMVSKGRARRPFLWSFQGGHGGNIGLPPQSKRSVCGGKRRNSGMSEPVPEGRRGGIWSLRRRNPPDNLSSGIWGCILLIGKEYIPSCRRSSPAPHPRRNGGTPRPPAGAKSRKKGPPGWAALFVCLYALTDSGTGGR